MADPPFPVSECSNDITSDIDVADPTEIVNLLKQCDAQIFNGWRSYKSLYDKAVLDSIESVANKVARVLEDDVGCVVLSGCGTSGRLAYYVACLFNRLLGKCKVLYTIAGGEEALWRSVEAPEDSWECGVDDLIRVSSNFETVVFIGISCGLSAPYVAGQLDYCLHNKSKYFPVLMGFNPVSQARNSPINKWDKTFRDVAMAMSLEENCYIINPVVGPEAISGSSRMKGGSVTKLLCEVIIFTALNNNASAPCPLENILMCYEIVHRVTYNQCPAIADIVGACGQSLVEGGRVYYISSMSCTNYGILARIDASECIPTFELEDIRGFVYGDGEDAVAIDPVEFHADIVPSIAVQDTVVLMGHGHSDRLVSDLKQRGCKLKFVDTRRCSHGVSVVVPEKAMASLLLNGPYASQIRDAAVEMSVKWTLNAVSTGAHILCGKVFANRMIDVQVSKLYNRAIGIIGEFSCVAAGVAEDCLLAAIYGSDPIPTNSTIYDHIEVATGKDKVVPCALLTSKLKCSHEKACSLLSETPTIRKLLVGIKF